jgi:hypothetical protein
MKFSKILIIVVFIFSFTGNSTAQSENEADIKKVIKLFFKGLQSGDSTTIKKTITSDAILQTTFIDKEGESILRTEDFNKFLKSIASKKPEDNWEEKLLSYNVQIDGNMANVWTPYKFYLNYKFSHCGVNSFQLFHNGEKWNIIYLIDTRRRLGCNN